MNTADPHCLFVNYGAAIDDSPSCTSVASSISNYTAAGSGFNHPNEPLPTDNSSWPPTPTGRLLLRGPDHVTLSVAAAWAR